MARPGASRSRRGVAFGSPSQRAATASRVVHHEQRQLVLQARYEDVAVVHFAEQILQRPASSSTSVAAGPRTLPRTSSV